MKLTIPKIRLATSVGIYLGETHLTWCVLEKKPWGMAQTEVGEEPCVKQDWAVGLNKLLERLKPQLSETASVVIGLPSSQAFFATLPAPTKNETAEQLLAGSHCCASIPSSDMAADMLQIKVNTKPFAAVGAARKKELATLTDVPRKMGYRFIRVEPGPWALMRTCSPSKPDKISLRLLVEGQHMIAALVCGSTPLLWRSLELTAPDAADMVVSAVRTFESYASQQLGESNLDEIILEGPAVKELSENLSSEFEDRIRSVEGAGPTSAAMAKGLALGGLERDKPAPDLARCLAPPPRLSDLIPRGEVALLGAVVICMSLWMWSVGTIVANKAIRVEDDIARSPILKSADDSKLKSEKKLLGAEVQAVMGFLENRILWTDYLSSVSGRVPKGVQLVEFFGEYEMEAGMKKNEKKTEPHVALSFEGLVPKHLSAPPEVNEILENIRTSPAIARDFPDVGLSVLRVNKNTQSRKELAGDPSSFTVSCYPKGKNPSAKKSGPPAGAETAPVAEAK